MQLFVIIFVHSIKFRWYFKSLLKIALANESWTWKTHQDEKTRQVKSCQGKPNKRLKHSWCYNYKNWNIGKTDSRGRIYQVLERGKHREHPLRNELKVAMPHVVHEINISDVCTKCSYRSSSSEKSCDRRYNKNSVICYDLSKRMNNSCNNKELCFVSICR